ncbi:Cof-type HAD-IIB family hydrolase [uncultured Merdimonas sp.]|uniref:Cof-type HAD-IIB family hydrolase n=1 Tax=uncultured Merdimonas sp. TaxID=2023269 RepID=UPI00320AE60B
MEKKAALFFDIDGTLIDDHTNELPESAAEAIRRARAAGHLVFINTGRTVCSVPVRLRLMGIDGLLCGCGTYINYRHGILLEHPIPEERGYRYIDAMIRFGMEGFLEGTEDVYFSERISRFENVESTRRYMASLGLGVERNYEKKGFCYDKLLVCTDAQSRKEEFFQAIAEDLVPIDRTRGVYECIQKGYSKATAIEFIRKYLNLDLDQIYVFGDSSNDLSMFAYARHGVAMGEHDPVLDDYAEYITDTVKNDGIRKAMEHLGLI